MSKFVTDTPSAAPSTMLLAVALKLPEPDAAKAEAYFQRALRLARRRQAKSWELRAATSLAHLWRDQGKVQQARELLAPVYRWFTEGFDTRDYSLPDKAALQPSNCTSLSRVFKRSDKRVWTACSVRSIMGLNAIAALRGDETAKAPSPTIAPKTDTPPEDRAERRQVTVMFSLVNSTALSALMDPEDLREVISAYQKCVAETVRRFGGFVAQYMGDGALIYFGYPEAHEDDAERAVLNIARHSTSAATGWLSSSNRSANSSRAGSTDDGVAGSLSIVASRSAAARSNATAFLSSPRKRATIPAAAKRWTST